MPPAMVKSTVVPGAGVSVLTVKVGRESDESELQVTVTVFDVPGPQNRRVVPSVRAWNCRHVSSRASGRSIAWGANPLIGDTAFLQGVYVTPLAPAAAKFTVAPVAGVSELTVKVAASPPARLP